MAVSDYSTTAASNTTIASIDVSGTTGRVKDGDNVMRAMAADMKAGLITGYTTTATAAGTTTLTVASNSYQYFTGTTTQTIAMPVTSTLELGRPWVFVNKSTGILTVNSSGGNLITKVRAGETLVVQCILLTGTSAASWNVLVERYQPWHLAGLTLSNNVSDATNDIDVDVGTARSVDDSGNLELTTAITKQLDAAWAVGTNAGGLDTGAIANATYHVFLIKRTDTSVVDVLFSTSATAPTMPNNYTLKRRIGSIIRSGGAIVAFKQYADRFIRDVPVQDVNSTNPGTSAVTQTLSVPTGINYDALINGYVFNGATATARSLLVTSLDQTDTTPTGGIYTTRAPAVANALAPYSAQVKTDSSARIRTRLEASDANTVISVVTYGWVDMRGRAGV